MNLTAFIPIKLNSQRIFQKNLIDLNGIPLITYIQRTLVQLKDCFDGGIYVFCSDESIKKYLLNGVKFLKRDQLLDSDSTISNEIIQSFIKEIDSKYYLFAHATTPFIKVETIKDIINVIETDTDEKYDSAFCAESMQNFLWDTTGNPINFDPSNISRTQDLKQIIVEKAGPFLFSKELFLKTKRRVGFFPYIHQLSRIESIDIDTWDDIDIAKVVSKTIN